MCHLEFNQSNPEIKGDIDLFQSFNEFCNKLPDEKVLYHSSKVRSIMDGMNTPPIAIKTYDKNISIINKEFDNICSGKEYYSNPVFQTTSSQLSNSHFHTSIFYRRLFFCLIQSQKPNDKENIIELQSNAKKTSPHIMSDQESKISAPLHKYTFDIHNFNMPPFFAPLFIGIMGSLTKGKTSWEKFRKNVLFISDSFCNTEHTEISQFMPNPQKRVNLFKYWLEIYFSDELFNFIDKLEIIIKNGNDQILSHNLYLLLSSLPSLTFLTRTGQKIFFQHMERILNQYMSEPMVDPKTLKFRNLDLFEEFTKAMLTIQNSEKRLLQYQHNENIAWG